MGRTAHARVGETLTLLQAVLGENVHVDALPASDDFRERRSAHREGPRWRIVRVPDGTARSRRALRRRTPGWMVRAWLPLAEGGAVALLEARACPAG